MKKILLVEDTLHLAEEIYDVLRLEGYSVFLANNGLQAIENLHKSVPDLIITDLLMPGMDGIEFIQHIRNSDLFKSIPIIILSAKASQADKNRGREAGADAYLQKPCKAMELINAIHKLMK